MSKVREAELRRTLGICADTPSRLDLLQPGPQVNCKTWFTILPLRYGAVGGSAAQRAMLPALPSHLARPQAVGTLTESAYALRPLRAGYLYVLGKRRSSGAHAWLNQFRVADNGILTYFEAGEPSALAEPRSNDHYDLKAAWMFKLYDLDDISEVRLLFSPAPLTKRMLNMYCVLPKYRDTLVAIDVAECASADPPPMRDVLTPTQLDLIADCAASKQPALKALLDTQAFPATGPAMHAMWAEMMPAGTRPEFRGAAIVVDDAIGMTMELNTWRNAGADGLHAFMDGEDDEWLTGRRKLTVAMAIGHVKQALADTADSNYFEYGRRRHVHYKDPEYISQIAQEIDTAQLGTEARHFHETYRNPAHEQQERERVTRQRRLDMREYSWEKYAPYVDEDRRQAFLAEYHQVVAEADALTRSRAADHLLWMKSEQLLDALDVFDRNDIEQGRLFEAELGKAIIGMNATQAGETLLAQWRNGATRTYRAQTCFGGPWHPTRMTLRRS